MTNETRLMALWNQEGLRSEGLGPPLEWDAVTPEVFQKRHNGFWVLVAGLIKSEPGEYDDLPQWMTEDAAEQLQSNN